jgi:hypothetical protein
MAFNPMDLFKAKPDTSAADAAAVAAAKIADDAAKAAAATKAAADPNNMSKDTQNPLDVYAKVFDTAAKNSDIQAPPSFSLDPKVIGDVASKMDFTKGLNPEVMAKATSGDAAAMMELIQQVGRNAYSASLEHTTRLTDTHLGQRSEFESKRTRNDVRSSMTAEAFASNANLQHPVVKKELNRIAADFAKSPEYADATPKQIATDALAYFNEIHAAMNPADPTKTPAGKAKAAEFDYVEYLTGQKSA